MRTLAGVAPVDLSDSRSFVPGVPHAWLAHLRRHDPVHWQDEAGGPGFWAVTKYHDCVTVNRDYERFSSAARGTMPFEMPDEDIAQQGLMMLNMDPPLHTRYRRLVNKGFTPRIVRDLEQSIHDATDAIIDQVIEKGEADFVTDISAELPLQVIAELLGVPADEAVIVASVPGDPPDPERLQVILDPDDPSKSVVIVPPPHDDDRPPAG